MQSPILIFFSDVRSLRNIFLHFSSFQFFSEIKHIYVCVNSLYSKLQLNITFGRARSRHVEPPGSLIRGFLIKRNTPAVCRLPALRQIKMNCFNTSQFELGIAKLVFDDLLFWNNLLSLTSGKLHF